MIDNMTETEPSVEAMKFVIKWYNALELSSFTSHILAKAIDELLDSKK